MSSETYDRAPRAREPDEDSGESPEERLNVTRVRPGEADAEPEADTVAETDSPLADEVDGLADDLADAEPDDSVASSPGHEHLQTDDGEPIDMTTLTDESAETVGEIVDYQPDEGDFVRLVTAAGETLKRKRAAVEHTADDWARRIMWGDDTLADAEPRIYQDVDGEEFRRMVRDALDRLESRGDSR